MPPFLTAKASNATFQPSYLPVAIFVGGTSGVGQGMVEGFARHVGGRAHIIIVGRNERAAAQILAHFPKPGADAVGWAHEFVACDVSKMANVRIACAAIASRVERINFLVMTAGYNSLVSTALSDDGLDLRLAMRYYHRYVCVHELLPLLKIAEGLGQDAKIMSVLGAGSGRPIDLDNLGNTVQARTGIRLRAALRSFFMSLSYTDAMIAHLASLHPLLAFTHIHPGVVRTSALKVDFDGLFTPLSWFLNWLLPLFAVPQDECAEHMLYALFNGTRGMFLRDRYGDVISAKVFEEGERIGEGTQTGILNGVPMKGYYASDIAVHRVMEHSEEVTREK
ncbi:hypothetical protein C8R44DRAFT_663819 [Mycena epipterygia]|nr:hypothetical protein C8R44DRAFT_663819 [Mycena epipterygia]